jgi:hypothetical protein
MNTVEVEGQLCHPVTIDGAPSSVPYCPLF